MHQLSRISLSYPSLHIAKFQNYMYGGRPLGTLLAVGNIPLCITDLCVPQMSDSTTVGTPSPRPLPRVVRVCFRTKAYNFEAFVLPLSLAIFLQS